ncbi:hypothetical protein [Magnetofaba australis]|uniref:hypothetical protein n=1 Tax=Magnetofaba australis TaxID=1472297 RepID=UPI000A19D748|nr:hypothetical protein [Magnetofaba australis]
MSNCEKECPYSAEMATLANELKHINQRLAIGQQKFDRMEATLDRLDAAEQRLVGGYKLFRQILALLALIAAFMAVPLINKP